MDNTISLSTTSELRPSLLRVAQILWLLITIPTITITIIGALQSSPQFARDLLATHRLPLNISQETFISLMTFSVIMTMFGYWSIGLLLFWRRSQIELAYVGSLTLVLVASRFFLQVYTEFSILYPNSTPIINSLIWLANGLTLLMIYTLPDGTFNPLWTRWLYFFKIFILVLWVIYSDSWAWWFNIALRVLIFFVPLVTLQYQRYRQTKTHIQRQQAKWALFGLLITVGAFYLYDIAPLLIPAFQETGSLRAFYMLVAYPLRNIALLMCPISFAIAIMRYRLVDIDLTINRSMVYGGLSIVLLTIFTIVFALLHSLFNTLIGQENDLMAVIGAAGTCIIWYNPTRRALRRFVDTRIYGLRYDLEQFAQARSREEKVWGVLSGKTIDQWEVGELIGRGGMGEVYRGKHDDKTVAIKILPVEMADEPHFRLRFEREAQTTASMNHPNIIHMIDYGVSDQLVYMVLEYIHGITLTRHIRQQERLSLRETRTIIRQIGDALDYAHAHHVVHRDLKPSNIMLKVNDNHKPILMDFGLAILPDHTQITGSAIIGSVDYMAPEQIQKDRPIDHRSDIYALGVMTYEMLTGQRPFIGGTAQVLFAHLQMPPPDIRQLMPELPGYINEAIQKAMAKDPNERFQSAGQFWEALTVTT